MAVINPLMNRTHIAIETGFFVASFSIMAPISVSYFLSGVSRFVSRDGMVSVFRIKN